MGSRNIHKILRRNDSYPARAAIRPMADRRAGRYSLILLGICAALSRSASWRRRVPVLSRGVAGVTDLPLGLLVLPAFYVVTLRRAVLDLAGSIIEVHAIAQA